MFGCLSNQSTLLNGRPGSTERNCRRNTPGCSQRIPEMSIIIAESIVWVVLNVVATRK